MIASACKLAHWKLSIKKLTSFSRTTLFGPLGLRGAREGLVSQAQELFISIVLFQHAKQMFFGESPFKNRSVQQNSQKIF